MYFSLQDSEISERREISRYYLRSVLEPFLKGDINFVISQSLVNVPKEIYSLHSCVVGVFNNPAPSFKRTLERSSIPRLIFSILTVLSF